MTEAKTKLAELVNRFRHNYEAYKNQSYNEAQVRREFIDPFFELLGWDMHNRQGFAEQYKDVIHEDAVKVGGATKAPDYSFRVGGVRKFFLEAKKPSVFIKGDPAPAYQLRRYAWSAKLPLSILCDFEEFAIYDCRKKPSPGDNTAAGRIAYYIFDQYPEKFDEIYAIFSKEAILKGSFDKYAESAKGKRGTGEVDVEFLKEIENWRDALAKNLALRNPELSVHELNYAVQITIDRIIFLRMAEDRSIEVYGQLQSLLNGANIYARLRRVYDLADQKYNSGLFDFKADTLSHTLNLDDKVLKEIIGNLYYPKSPYEFSVLGADILGNVYEQFLGKVIRLTAGHQAKIEEKPEVKKAGGVFYTPAYIVEYIVKNTVGKLTEGKSPKEIEKLRILDPACGSGSFLLGAYQYLLDYHLNWYRANDPLKHAKGKNPAVYQTGTGDWRLTTGLKKRILLNNIYGVDIDRQAVEVTKLSLLLKVLEGESGESLNQQMTLLRERALPSLEKNIKCGNSLIGPDFYAQMTLGKGLDKGLKPLAPGVRMNEVSEEDIRRINVFDWEKEFAQVFGGNAAFVDKGLKPLVSDAALPWFVTFVTHNSRISERMITYGVSVGEPLVFAAEDQVFMVEQIMKACKDFGFALSALNVLPDHFHMIGWAANEKELEEKIGKVKGAVSRLFQQAKGWQKETVWAQKFNREPIPDEESYRRISEYIANNHLKHAERWGKDLIITYETRLKPLLEQGLAEAQQDKGLQPLAESPAAVSQVSHGFDCVIGNPPYVRQEMLTEFKPYLQSHYTTYHGVADLYVYFIEKGVNLLKEGGIYSIIVANKWMRANYGEPLRRWMKGQKIEQIIDFGDLPVFQTATTYPCILQIAKGKTRDQTRGLSPLPLAQSRGSFTAAQVKTLDFTDLGEYVQQHRYTVNQKGLSDSGWSLSDTETEKLLKKIKSQGVPLEKYVNGKIYRGVLTGLNEAFGIDKSTKDRLIAEDPKSAELIKPFLVGRDVKRYAIADEGRYLILIPKGWTREHFGGASDPWKWFRQSYPAIAGYLEDHREKAESRYDKGEFWWELRACDYYAEFEKPKIIYAEIATKGQFTLDSNHFYSDTTTYIMGSDSKYLVGILNSRLWTFLFSKVSSEIRGGFYRWKRQYMEALPIRTINFKNKDDKSRHDKMVELVDKMLELNKKLAAAKLPADKELYQRQIEMTNRQIDQLVYELYGVTEAEIKIVEGEA